MTENVQVPSKLGLSTFKIDLIKAELANVDTKIYLAFILLNGTFVKAELKIFLSDFF